MSKANGKVYDIYWNNCEKPLKLTLPSGEEVIVRPGDGFDVTLLGLSPESPSQDKKNEPTL